VTGVFKNGTMPGEEEKRGTPHMAVGEY